MSDNIKPALPTKKTFKQRMPPILTWSDPVKSGGSFASAIVLLLLLKFGSILPFVLWIAYWLFGVSTFTEYFTRSLYGEDKGLISSSVKPSQYLMVQDVHIQNSVQVLADSVTSALKEFRRILDVQDPFTSMVACGLSYILCKAIGLVSLWTLLVLSTILAFTVPALYLKFEKTIDANFHKATKISQEKVDSCLSQINKTTGPYVEDIKERVDSVVSTVRSSRGGFESTDVKGQDFATSSSSTVEKESVDRSEEVYNTKETETSKKVSVISPILIEETVYVSSEPISETIPVPIVTTETTTFKTLSTPSDASIRAVNEIFSNDSTASEPRSVPITHLKSHPAASENQPSSIDDKETAVNDYKEDNSF
ncbi:hypothetical protein NADFUDRAFT_44848 [Nadsonia fulvescens var. elongata DSM 6958]|uniref:Reticulon-like protein n=1 Tax=Nadsonia fulvescens var. elongata DSM 6958 TaxID=857566 RepID=A0A1E3PTH0_9ASCO|nr:hypothetical protein NADFUDRAFT_44848 [Nadsonia fulvescens var. elongata DSM 6958]